MLLVAGDGGPQLYGMHYHLPLRAGPRLAASNLVRPLMKTLLLQTFMFKLSRCLAVAFVAVLCLAPAGRAQDPVAVPAPRVELQTQHPLSRVAFIGASVSAGFGNARELKVGRNVKLGHFFEQMLGQEHGQSQIHNFGSSQFFTAPLELGERQVASALEKQPTLVVGIDFLFWYAFGFPRIGNARRLEGLRKGLKRLESVDCLLIVGDLPNVDHALHGKSPLRAGHAILSPGQIPSEEERLQMNRMIREWAAGRKNVTVFPLADLMKQMVGGDKMTLQGNEWKVEELDQVLQPDLLHPRVRGMVWVAMYVAEATAHLPGVEKADFIWSESEIRKELWASLEPARAKQQRLEERRIKRRAKRDAKKAAANKD